MLKNCTIMHAQFANSRRCIVDSGHYVPDSGLQDTGGISRLRGITRMVLLSLSLVWLGITAGAQSLSVYPSNLQVTTNCDGKTSKTLTIENYGAQNLTYSASTDMLAEIVESTTNFVPYSCGMVAVGDYIYALDYNYSVVIKYDKATETMLSYFYISSKKGEVKENAKFEASALDKSLKERFKKGEKRNPHELNAAKADISPAITYDGENLWIAFSDGNAVAYTLDGNLTDQSFMLPATSWPMLAYDGQYFITANGWENNPTFYKVDHTGKTISTYASSNINLNGLTIDPSGNLWVLDWYNDFVIKEISLIGSSAKTISTVDFSPYYYAYAILHDGTDLYIGYEGDDNLYRYEYGSGFLTLKNTEGTVTPGSSGNIIANFDATGLTAGTYNKTIYIETNDPLNETYTVDVEFTITGEPEMTLSNLSFDFGNTIIGAPLTQKLLLGSFSCQPIQMSNITSTNAAFTVDNTNFEVYKSDTFTLNITFNPTVLGDYTDTLTLYYNGTDTIITLSASCIEPPVMLVTAADTLYASVSCGGTQTGSFTIANNGVAGLNFSNTAYSNQQFDLDEVLVKLDDAYSDITALIPNKYSFSDGITGNNIDDGGNDMYDGGNYLNTNFNSNISYSNGSIVTGGAMGTNGSYFTRKYNGLFVMAAKLDGVSSFSITGNNGADGGGSVDGSVLTVVSNGVIYKGFLKRVYNAGDPSINQLIIVKQNNLIGHTFSTNTNDGLHTVSDLSQSTELFYLLYAGSNGLYINDNDASAIMNKFLGIIGPTVKFISFNPQEGTIASGNTTNVSVGFNAGNYASGIYNGGIVISSNDLITPSDTIPFVFTVSGSAEMALSASSIGFNTIMVGTSLLDTVLIKNTGCDTLKISSITSTNGAFDVNVASNVLAYDSAAVLVNFIPTVAGDYNDTIVIVTNIGNDTLFVTGKAIESPILAVTPDTINVAVTTCGGTTTGNFTIANNLTGTTALEYNCKVIGAFDSANAGKLLTTYKGSSYYEDYGMVKVDHYLYIVNHDNYSLDRYDLATQTLQTLAQFSSEPSGITFDGTVLWVGEIGHGVMSAYDLLGIATGASIEIPVYYPVITYNGTDFIVANRWSGYPTIYKIDYDGNTVESYSSSINYLYDFTWVPEHNSLWAVDSYNYLQQVSLSNGVAENVQTVDFGYEVYALAHDGIDLLCGDYYSPDVYRITDGIEENPSWITLSGTTGTVAAGATTNITATFTANVKAGTHQANVIVSSNDVNNNSDTVVCLFTVSGTPDMQLSATAFAFGDGYIGFPSIDTLWVKNSGCDTLKVSSLVSSEAVFTTDPSAAFNVAPYDSLPVFVNFTPVANTGYSANLTLTSNNATPSVVVTATGSGILVPYLALSNDTIMDTITCSGTRNHTINLSNTGQGVLNYTNTIVYDEVFDAGVFGDVLDTYNNMYYYNYGMTFVGKYLYTSNGDYNAIQKYDTARQQVVARYELDYWPCGMTYDGQYLWVASEYGIIKNYDLNGNAIGDSILTGVYEPFLAYDGTNFIVMAGWTSYPTIYKINHAGQILASYSSDINYSYGITWSAKHNALWVIDSNGGYLMSQLKFDGDQAVTSHTVNPGLSEGNGIYHDGTDLYYCTYYGQLYRVDDGITEEVPAWISLTNTSGTVAASSQTSMAIAINSEGLVPGTYTSGIVVATNDPSNAIDTVFCSLTVEGEAIMSLSPSNLDFENAFVGVVITDTVFVTNNGCGVLNVSNIANNLSVFSVDNTSFDVLPGYTFPLVVSFNPLATGTFTDSLFITSNSGIDTFLLNATAINPSVLEVTPKTLTGLINACEGTVETSFTITNQASAGAGDLNYTISVIDQYNETPNYISLSQYADTLATGGSSTVEVTFDAAALASGTYQGEIVVESNDPSNTADTVAYGFVIDGDPVMELSVNSISFPEVPVNSNVSYNPIKITNSGCDTLFISDIVSDTNAFYLYGYPSYIPAYSSATIFVYFTPQGFGNVNGTLTLYNNYNTDTVISLTGTGAQTKIVSVVSNTIDGYYNAGDVVNLSARFSNLISLQDNGDVTIALNTTPVAYATLTNISGRDADFEYVVGANDNSADLDYIADTLTMNGSIITDNNGNVIKNSLPAIGTFAALYNIVIDNVKPTVLISSNNTNPTSVSPVPMVVTFSEVVQGFEASDLFISNGTAANLVSLSDTSYLVEITPISNGDITVSLAADLVPDLAGNLNTASNIYTIEFDASLPVLAMTSTISGLTNVSPILVTVTSSVSVTGLELADFNVVNGVASNLVTLTAGTQWTVDITPSADGAVNVTLPVSSVVNSNSNPNVAAVSISFDYDGSKPLFTITTTNSNPTNVNPIAISIALSEVATGLDSVDVVLENGALLNFTKVSELLWTANVNPIANGEVTVTIPAGIVIDSATNANAEASLSIFFDDVEPTVVVSSEPALTNADTIAFTVVFSEKVYGFAATDITVANGSVTAFETADSISFTANVKPVADGVVSVNVTDSVAFDLAGNANTEAAPFSVTYDGTLPQIVNIASSNLTAVSVTIGFTSNKDGKLFYALLKKGVTPPTSDQIIDGSVVAIASGEFDVVANTEKTAAISGLESATAYTVYAVVVDVFETASEIETFDFTTLNTSVTDENARVNLYPNPVIDKLNIELEKLTGTMNYQLYSINGQLVAEGTIDNQNTTIDVSNLSEGTYSLRLITDNNVKTYKVVKQ